MVDESPYSEECKFLSDRLEKAFHRRLLARGQLRGLKDVSSTDEKGWKKYLYYLLKAGKTYVLSVVTQALDVDGLVANEALKDIDWSVRQELRRANDYYLQVLKLERPCMSLT